MTTTWYVGFTCGWVRLYVVYETARAGGREGGVTLLGSVYNQQKKQSKSLLQRSIIPRHTVTGHTRSNREQKHWFWGLGRI